MIPEPEQPEYFLDSFPRDDFPRYVWTERPPTLPAAAWTTETTHRDGQQGGLPLTVEQSLHIYDILCDFTGTSGAIRQAEFFVYRPSDRAALEGALERYHGGAPIEPTTWIRATAKDVALIGSLGVRETGMLASASDYHTFHKFKPGGRNQAAQTYLDAVRVTVEAGIRPRLHLEDATRAPMDFMQAVHRSRAGNLRALWRRPAPQVPRLRHDGLGPALRRRCSAAQHPAHLPRTARAGLAAGRFGISPAQRYLAGRRQLPRRHPRGLRRHQRHVARQRRAHRQRPARRRAACT